MVSEYEKSKAFEENESNSDSYKEEKPKESEGNLCKGYNAELEVIPTSL